MFGMRQYTLFVTNYKLTSTYQAPLLQSSWFFLFKFYARIMSIESNSLFLSLLLQILTSAYSQITFAMIRCRTLTLTPPNIPDILLQSASSQLLPTPYPSKNPNSGHLLSLTSLTYHDALEVINTAIINIHLQILCEHCFYFR